MAFSSAGGGATTGSEAAQRFLEGLQGDFRTLAQDTKKKNPQIKEVIASSPFSQLFTLASF